MASPAVVGTPTETAISTASTSHTVNLPNGATGNLLIAILSKGSAGTTPSVNALAGWTELLDEAIVLGLYVACRVCDGTEGATTTFTLSSATRGAWIVYEISGAADPATQAPQVGTTATGSGTTPDPPSVSVTGGSKDILTIACFGRDGEEADDDTWVTSAPSGFGSLLQIACGVAGTNLAGMLATAHLASTTATSNPGTFSAATGGWRAQTIVVHPVPPQVATKTGAGILTGSGSLHWVGTRIKQAVAILGKLVWGGTGIRANVVTGTDAVVFVESGAGVRANVGSGVAVKSGAAVYTKDGSGIRALVGSGTDVFTAIDSGSGIRVQIASGADVTSFIDTGSGVSPRVSSGADVTSFIDAGTGVLAAVGSGAAVEVAADIVKTGAGIRGHVGSAADSALFIDSGAGITTLTSAGEDATQFNELGAAITARVGSGTDAVESTEQGSGILAAVGSGPKVVGGGATYIKTGLGRLGSGAVISSKTGAGIRVQSASGTDAVAYADAGAGIRGQVASGTGRKDAIPGTGVSARIGSGTDTTTRAESGSGITARVASAADAVIYVESGAGEGGNPPLEVDSGAGISGRVASGASVKVAGGGATTKTGAGVRGHSAAATDQVASTDTGAGNSPRVGSAQDAATFVDSGAGIRGHVGSGSGARGAENVKTGTATSAHTAAGVDAITYGETATTLTARVATGTDSATFVDRGSGVLERVGSGSKFKLGEHVKFGFAVSARIASGVDVIVIQLPPNGTISSSYTGRFTRVRRGRIARTDKGGVLTP